MAWLYILRCGDGSHYVGTTEDLEGQILFHKQGRTGTGTLLQAPVSLIHTRNFATLAAADSAKYRLQQENATIK